MRTPGDPLPSLPDKCSVLHAGFQSNTGFTLVLLREKLAGLQLMCSTMATMATGFQDGASPVALECHSSWSTWPVSAAA